MATITLEAESRQDLGKSASRRLRRLEKIPAVVYGSEQEPTHIVVAQNKFVKALENEKIFSSVFDLNVDGNVQQVILKALHRHPYRSVILHADLQRVSKKDVLTKSVPLHFIHEDVAPGVKAGGIVTHAMTLVEIRCQAKDLPEFIEVDMSGADLNAVLHLSDLTLPSGVQLTTDLTDGSHNLPVVSIHAPKAAPAAEEEVSAEPTPEA